MITKQKAARVYPFSCKGHSLACGYNIGRQILYGGAGQAIAVLRELMPVQRKIFVVSYIPAVCENKSTNLNVQDFATDV